MNSSMKKIEDLFKNDNKVKQILMDCIPKEEYGYDKESTFNYADKLYKALGYIEKALIESAVTLNFSFDDLNEINDKFKGYRDMLVKYGDNYRSLKSFYNIYLTDMNEEFIKKVGENTHGYSINHMGISEAKSVNEITHLIHKRATNDETIYEQMPLLAEKSLPDGDTVRLMGNRNEISEDIYNNINPNLKVGDTDILSLNDKILMMIRDKGHALSFEINKEDDCYFVNYNIPKNCNYEMINRLKGVRKIGKEDVFTTGVFKDNPDEVVKDVIEVIKNVPTDEDMYSYGGALR